MKPTQNDRFLGLYALLGGVLGILWVLAPPIYETASTGLVGLWGIGAVYLILEESKK